MRSREPGKNLPILSQCGGKGSATGIQRWWTKYGCSVRRYYGEESSPCTSSVHDSNAMRGGQPPAGASPCNLELVAEGRHVQQYCAQSCSTGLLVARGRWHSRLHLRASLYCRSSSAYNFTGEQDVYAQGSMTAGQPRRTNREKFGWRWEGWCIFAMVICLAAPYPAGAIPVRSAMARLPVGTPANTNVSIGALHVVETEIQEFRVEDHMIEYRSVALGGSRTEGSSYHAHIHRHLLGHMGQQSLTSRRTGIEIDLCDCSAWMCENGFYLHVDEMTDCSLCKPCPTVCAAGSWKSSLCTPVSSGLFERTS